MAHKVLLAWIGNTDVRASAGELGKALGPIGQAVQDRNFSYVFLLSNYDEKKTKAFSSWLKSNSEARIAVLPRRLSDPTNFSEIYQAAVSAIEEVMKDFDQRGLQLTFHLSPGTPAMAAIWIILGKTKYPAELIQSSEQKGVQTVSFPFEIAADYLLTKAGSDDEIVKLTQGLAPEVAEFAQIIYRSPAMKRLIAQARRVAAFDAPVLIQGETGTGKELVSKAIHAASSRRAQPFVPVNCGAIPSELFESELFGHEKGAFTGAFQRKVGVFERANGGTLFLDEIGEIPLVLQPKILRALQEGEIRRIGGQREIKVDVRVIAATNRNLFQEVSEGRFREDLFYRLAVLLLHIPPLRERQTDLNLLIDHFMNQLNQDIGAKSGLKDKKLSAGARNLMNQHPWPGNVRELWNTLLRAYIWTSEEMIQGNDIRLALLPGTTVAVTKNEGILNRPLGKELDVRELVGDVARHYLKRALAEANGNKTEAAKLLGLPSYQTLTNWLEKYRVE